jgi:hypothetical protein
MTHWEEWMSRLSQEIKTELRIGTVADASIEIHRKGLVDPRKTKDVINSSKARVGSEMKGA